VTTRQRIDACSVTHLGLVRTNNEDAYRCTPSRGVFVVADGIGGHPGGELASSLAVEGAHEALVRGYSLRESFSHANHVVAEAASKDTALRGMGTTIVMVRVTIGCVDVGWCGDSRAYLYRNRVLIPLTQDHGSDGTLSAYCGDPHREVFEERNFATESGDRILLCTDGLSNFLSPLIIANQLRLHKEPQAAVRSLLREALAVGGHDNVTITVVRVRS